ncbi:MAG: hypothetical protein JO165_10315 [Candidatus Eremiobacteraeota bacterium]|nr:hypothetical protein [Candidatus Eremiobacteraeota bacterium]
MRRFFPFSLAILIVTLAACSGGAIAPTTQGPAPNTLSAARMQPDAPVPVLRVDPNMPIAAASNQYIHIYPTHERETATLRPFFTSADDLIDHGGAVMHGGNFYNVYVNCAASCWAAAPAGFEVRLGAGAMIHIVDQYRASGTYGYGAAVQSSYSTAHTLYDNDMRRLVVAYILEYHTPAGYDNIYNVYLKQGVDECDSYGVHESGNLVEPAPTPTPHYSCYSPDVPSKFAFCAYHGSFDYGGIGHILYSVEPYQGVTNCLAKPPYPNSQLADSTDSTLSHELFETITDPDGHAWFNRAGDEIGDICRPDYNTVTLVNRQYRLQGEYSNRITNCAW